VEKVLGKLKFIKKLVYYRPVLFLLARSQMEASFHLIRAKQKGVNTPLLATYQEAKPPLDSSRLAARNIHF